MNGQKLILIVDKWFVVGYNNVEFNKRSIFMGHTTTGVAHFLLYLWKKM